MRTRILLIAGTILLASGLLDLLAPSGHLVPEVQAQDRPAEKAPADPLPSWNDGRSKTAILDFVVRVTKEGGPASGLGANGL